MRENPYPGNFIVIEGADGSGTSTQVNKLKEKYGFHITNEPSENDIGKKVEKMISKDDYQPSSIALAFASDRMVHLDEEIIPKLKKGETVVSDRYYHSSLVYQPSMGLDFKWVMELNKKALRPDQTFILDISADIGMERIKQREGGKDGNIFEDLDFQEQVTYRYKELDQKLDEKIKVIDSSQTKEKVFKEIDKLIKKRFRT